MRPSPKREVQLVREISSWLDDEQQLAELGSRCVRAMLSHRAMPSVTPGATSADLLRSLLVDDWLLDI